MKGFGFFLGGVLLETLGFQGSLWAMAAVLAVVLLGVVNALWMTPIMTASMLSIQWLLQPLAHMLLLTSP